MTKNNFDKTRRRYSKALIVGALVLLVVAALGGITLASRHKSPPLSKTPATEKPTSTINYNKPTQQETQTSDSQKQVNVDRQKTDSQPVTASATADLRLTDAAQYVNTIEVRAFVTNVYESGSCVAVFTRAGQPTITTTSTAFKDASTTQCGANDTDRSKFSVAGDWQLTLTYTSASGKVGSATKTVAIK